jgi:hypothetical protein
MPVRDEAVRIGAVLSGHGVGMQNGCSGGAERLQAEEAGDCEPKDAPKKQSHHRIIRGGDETAVRRRWSKKTSARMIWATFFI